MDSALPAVELRLSPEHLRRLDDIFPGHKTAPEEYTWCRSAHPLLWVPNGHSRRPFSLTGGMRYSNVSYHRLTAGREPAARNCSNKRATWRFLLCLFATG